MSLKRKQFVFGPFRLDPANHRLFCDLKPIPLAPKAFDTLVYLVENSRRLVPREDLIKAVWPDATVEDANLTVNISLLRKALGRRDDGQPYIETIPTKGYRFNADIELIESMPEPLELVKSTPTEMLPILQSGEGELLFQSPGTPDAAAQQTAVITKVEPRPELKFLPKLPEATQASSHLRKNKKWVLGVQRRYVLAAALGLVSIGLVIGWILWHTSHRLSQFRQRRLTSFATEAAITAAAISTGGKFIAYANASGLFIQVIATAETHPLELPEPDIHISSISWFPDSAKLLIAGASPSDETPSLWIAPVIGNAKPVKIGPYQSGVVSADGSEIALLGRKGSLPEILVMRPDGTEARTLVTGAEDETLGRPCWSHDREHLLFTRYRWNPQLRGNSGSIESCELATGKTTTLLTDSDFGGDVVSSPNGRILYSRILGANPSAYGGELVQVHTDRRTGKAVGQPLLIAKWDVTIGDLSVNADGKYLVFRDVTVQHSVYLGDWKDREKSLLNVRRFTFGLGREDFPRAWTPDSKSIFIDSNRNGNWEIFKQPFDGVSDAPFVQGIEDQFGPRVSPDDNWLLYWQRPRNWREPQPVRLLRVPISGGPPQLVLTASECSEWGLRFECPQRAGMPCVLAQRQGRDVAFRRFDPIKGFEADKEEIARHGYDPDHPANWTIAPDGSHLAWIKRDPNEARIHVLALLKGRDGLAGEGEQEVVMPGWSHLHAISWALDGKGWFVVARFPASWTLLYVDAQGKAYSLLRVASTFAPDIYPSPDGRHLAFSEQDFGSNVWLLENF
ncbi:MAG TPA: winged helix-turn-helix domain-containing protein [Bryobacteraceae bacterium]|nr:winged helix-turn-helix domain-containing protein [Bryobacteraceae bacterium]